MLPGNRVKSCITDRGPLCLPARQRRHKPCLLSQQRCSGIIPAPVFIMKRFLIIPVLFFLLMLSGPAFSQTAADEASGRLRWADSDSKDLVLTGQNYGLAEEPGIIHAKYIPSNLFEKAPFPEKYDARDAGLITAVKDQRPYDLCWAESVMSMAESNLIKKGYAGKDYDLSEIFAHYFQWHRTADPLGLTAGDENIWIPYESYPGFIREWINSWGSGYRAVLLLSGWPGLVPENTAPYPSGDADIMNYKLDPQLAWHSNGYQLDTAYWISMNDTQAIKRMIQKYGSIVLAFNQNRDKYLNPETGAYYCPDDLYTNHLVNVIGWDDTYPGSNFLSRPDVDGAWLVKNSFGTEWGNKGYFWLSYDDHSLSEDAFVYDFSPSENDVNCYQYDGSVSYNYLNDPNADTFAAANVFTAVNNEKLEAVGFLTPSSYFSYNIEIYRGVKDRPDSGVLFAKQSGEKLDSGYHTIKLDNPVDLVSGDRFSIIVEIIANGKGNAYIMTDRSESFTVFNADNEKVVFQKFVSSSNPGESFYRSAKGEWIDCWDADPKTSLGNVRIKAYTRTVSTGMRKAIEIPPMDGILTDGMPQLIRLETGEERNYPVPSFTAK